MQVTLFFDLEAWWGNPFKERFDLAETIKTISYILDKFKAKAVFNTCGALGEEFPALIKKLFSDGHEISCHGYKHEFFLRLSSTQIEEVLYKTEKIIKRITGQRPIGLRCPLFYYDSRIYPLFKKRRYKWLSNECLLPRLKTPFQNQVEVNNWRKILEKDILLTKMKTSPFINNGILEIPLLSYTDVCLLGYVKTKEATPLTQLNLAYEVFKTEFQLQKNFFNLNFHCWAIGTTNRFVLLEKILQYITNHSDVRFILPRELVLEL